MKLLRILFTALQTAFAVQCFGRTIRTANGTRIQLVASAPVDGTRVSVLVPVLNEVSRLGPCLDGLVRQGPEVAEILVIDGGSTDGTRDLIRRWADHDPRILLVEAAPVPEGVNGKAHNLQAGFRSTSTASNWILTIDADVRPKEGLVRSLLAHARRDGVEAFSVATQQELSGAAEGLIHPSMLATLVYRYGIPGHATTNLDEIQANGQCFLVRRSILESVGGFEHVMHDVSEDVTLARVLTMHGHPVGFYESEGLVSVEMYSGWRDAWDNWTRSLPMRDRFALHSSAIRLLEATFVQALPSLLAPYFLATLGRQHPATLLNFGLLAGRYGVLMGMSRAYRDRPWTYWLSPFADIPVLARIWLMWGRRTHQWRGRTLISGENE